MTHRTVDFGAGPVEVFDTGMAALHWARLHPGDCKILARGRFYFQRKDGAEMIVRLEATECEANRHLVSAANAVADEVERTLERFEQAGLGARGDFLFGSREA
jgi:hypothetical protein